LLFGHFNHWIFSGANGAALKDIASVVGQIQQQPAITPFSSNGSAAIAPLIQAQTQQTSYPAYQSLSQNSQLSSAFEQPQFTQQTYAQQPQAQLIRQGTFFLI
jgi:hypothetical protein